MYLWKCWRDTRSVFFVFLIIAAAIMPVAAIVCVGTGLMKDFGAEAFQTTFGTIIPIGALVLGAMSASEELAQNTAHFLFTKPRSRAYFVWTGFTVSYAEFLAIALANLVSGWMTLSHYNNHPFESGTVTMQVIFSALTLGLFIFCLAYSLTALLRSGLKGVAATMAIIFGSEGFSIAIRLRWHINVPIPTMPIGSLPPLLSDLLWVLIALSFIFAAQHAVERAEI